MTVSNVLIIQNHPADPSGLLGDFFRQNNISFQVDFQPMQKLDLAKFDALVILGGPPNAKQDKEYPYLVEEKRLILEANSLGKKVLGICLGAQLAAVALGGNSSPIGIQEFGWTSLDFAKNKSFQNITPLFFESHADWITVPNGVEVIARNANGIQAFTFENITGVQFHPEVNQKIAGKMAARLPEWKRKSFNARKHLQYAEKNAEKLRENAFKLFENIFLK